MLMIWQSFNFELGFHTDCTMKDLMMKHHANMAMKFRPPSKPSLYSKTGVYKDVISAQKHRLWVLVTDASMRRFK